MPQAFGDPGSVHGDLTAAARQALEVSVAGQRRLIAAEDAGLYRDALGIAMEGDDRLGNLLNLYVRCEEVLERIRDRPSLLYFLAGGDLTSRQNKIKVHQKTDQRQNIRIFSITTKKFIKRNVIQLINGGPFCSHQGQVQPHKARQVKGRKF